MTPMRTMVKPLVAKAPDECPICHTASIDVNVRSQKFQRQGKKFSASGLACQKCDLIVYIMPAFIKQEYHVVGLKYHRQGGS